MDADAIRKGKDRAAEFVAKGKIPAAVEIYRTLVREIPTDLSLRQKVADLLHRGGKPREAIAEYDAVVKAYAQRGELLKAISLAKVILQIDPKHTATQSALAELVGRQRGEGRGAGVMITPTGLAPKPLSARSTSAAQPAINAAAFGPPPHVSPAPAGGPVFAPQHVSPAPPGGPVFGPQGLSVPGHAPQLAPQPHAPQSHGPQGHAPQSHAPQAHAAPLPLPAAQVVVSGDSTMARGRSPTADPLNPPARLPTPVQPLAPARSPFASAVPAPSANPAPSPFDPFAPTAPVADPFAPAAPLADPFAPAPLPGRPNSTQMIAAADDAPLVAEQQEASVPSLPSIPVDQATRMIRIDQIEEQGVYVDVPRAPAPAPSPSRAPSTSSHAAVARAPNKPITGKEPASPRPPSRSGLHSAAGSPPPQPTPAAVEEGATLFLRPTTEADVRPSAPPEEDANATVLLPALREPNAPAAARPVGRPATSRLSMPVLPIPGFRPINPGNAPSQAAQTTPHMPNPADLIAGLGRRPTGQLPSVPRPASASGVRSGDASDPFGDPGPSVSSGSATLMVPAFEEEGALSLSVMRDTEVRSSGRMPAWATQAVMAVDILEESFVDGRAQGPVDEGWSDTADSGESIPIPAASIDGDLPHFPLFSDVPKDAFIALVASAEVRTRAAGERVFAEGDDGRSMFAIVQGLVTLRLRQGKRERAYAALGPGQFFGEMAIVSDAPRLASVVCEDDTVMLEFERSAMQRIMSEHPQVARELERYHRERLLSNVMRATPLFDTLDDDSRQQLSAQLKLRTIPENEAVLRHGTPGEGLFVVIRGLLAVIDPMVPATRSPSIPDLEEGDVFGVLSSMLGDQVQATVRARVPSVVVNVPADALKALTEKHTVVRQLLAAQARERWQFITRRRGG